MTIVQATRLLGGWLDEGSGTGIYEIDIKLKSVGDGVWLLSYKPDCTLQAFMRVK